MGYHTVDDDSVLAYIRANPAAFRAQLRAISLGIDTRAIDWVAGYEWAQTPPHHARAGRRLYIPPTPLLKIFWRFYAGRTVSNAVRR